MKKIFTLLFIAISIISSAKTVYVATNGNNSNNGSINSPWLTWEYAWSQLSAGDILYIRGGTYQQSKSAGTSVQISWGNKNGTSGNLISILNYPGETPVMDFSDVLHTTTGVFGLSLQNSSYILVKGLRITGLAQSSTSSVEGFAMSNCNNVTIENCVVDYIGGSPFTMLHCTNCTWKNCDASNSGDPYNNYEGANGFQITGAVNTSTGITLDGCRAWWICDDGFDFFGLAGTVTLNNCWSFWNGYAFGSRTTYIGGGADGNGFKVGPGETNDATVRRTYNNCIAFENYAVGFEENYNTNAWFPVVLTNCVSYGNAYSYDFTSDRRHKFTNNIDYGNKNGRSIGAQATQTTNSWQGGLTVNNSDFLSVSSAGMNGPRQSDGSLPVLNFMHLASGSDLIDAGTNVGMPFNGSAPDIGAFETGGAAVTNQSPTANAGSDKNITLPTNSITQSGGGTDPDGVISSYLWTKIAGPATFSIVSPTQAQTVINKLVQGTYQFELRVTDNQGATGSDTMVVTVNAASNQTPTANAGSDKNITLPINTITQTGSGSDPDGTITAYQWTKIAGPATFSIVSPTQAQTIINNLVQGTYQFELRVTDNQGAVARDTMVITVNPATNQSPTANAGNDINVTLPVNSFTQTGSGSDPDGTIASYEWSKVSGPAQYVIISPLQPQTVINNLVQGNYKFELKVTDNQGAVGRDTMSVTVNAAPPPANQAPTANAGPDNSITLPTNYITQTGSGTDPDGYITNYQWTKISGPSSFTIVSPTQSQTVINNLVQGTYQFALRVTDNSGAYGRDTMLITVNAAPPANQAPTANAGPNQNITLPVNSVTSSGSGTDPDGTISAYLWTKISGPAQYNILFPTQAQTVINNLVQGTYQFELRVTDNQGAVGRDTIFVVVNAGPPPPANQAPLANAGPNTIITLPVNSATISGSGSDPDGYITNYQWTKISGPAQFYILFPTQAQTVINNLVQGNYQFELRVTDNQGAVARDTIVITVNAGAPPPVNQSPSANAGSNITITLPANSVTISGSGTDPDGYITTYQWTKISGPTQFNIVFPAQGQTVINNLVQGNYQFVLTVTDNQGALGRDTMSVIVNAAPPPANQAPTANAGPDNNITLPANSITQTGSGTDPDGTITAYLWTKISGPATFTIVSPNQAQTVINNLIQGTYQFALRVTDNSGAYGRDTMIITVNAAPPANQAPTANAGPNQNVTLPVNSVIASGSGTDPDGTIAAYLWTKISGPAQYNILFPTQAQTVINNLVQGNYQFELTVTDNQGAVGKDTISVTVNAAPSPNQAPTANAGQDNSIILPTNYITQTGSGTDPDGTITAYLWTKISGPASFTIVSPNQAQTVITNLVQGTYQFALRVTDNSGAFGRDTMVITVNAAPPANQAPTANAGPNQNITLPVNSVTVSGSGTDPDGTISAYLWTKISGPAQYNILFPTQAQTVINNLVQGTYQFELTVTDNQGAVGRDTIFVVVNAGPPPPANQAPSANAGPNTIITLPVNSVTVSGSGTDPDGTISAYLWTKISGPAQFYILFPNQAQTVINNLVQGTYQFELQVTDNQGAVARDTMVIIVNAGSPPPANQAPSANAGPNTTITLPVNSVTVSGSGADPDGYISTYQWTKISGPTQYNIVFPAQGQTVINNLVQGIYRFELTVTDNQGAVSRDTMSVTVNAAPPPANQAPTANAGSDNSITLPTNYITQTGSGTDPDGTITAYLWTKISGPASFTIVSPNLAQTVITNLVQGTYQFALRVTDNSGAYGRDTMVITVNAAPPANQAPTANAGSNQNITLPVNSVTASGSGTDPDGTISAYLWTKISGPAQYNILFPTQAQTVINNLVQGIYEFELLVTDNQGAVGRDTMVITVNAGTPPPANQAPSANAGPNTTITLPVNSVTISGSGTDPDGYITNYQWTKISGPAQFYILFPNQAQTVINNLVQGTYQFELLVTDNQGAVARDTMVITVNAGAPPPVNQAPSSNAGSNITITLPVNSVIASGSGTDPDGTISAYLWTKISGPAQYNILFPTQAQTVINNLVQGIYQFELTVTDNQGAVANDIMTVTVNAVPPVPNQAPIANAGPDQIITLPANAITINGTGTDPDGTIVSYQWNKISGPSQYTIVSPTQAKTEFKDLAEGTYQFELVVTDNRGSSDRDTVEVRVYQNQSSASSARIYPNPATTTINIQIDAITNANKTLIQIFSVTGNLMYQKEVLRTQQLMVIPVDISNFINGTYLVKIGLDINNSSTLLFVKQ